MSLYDSKMAGTFIPNLPPARSISPVGIKTLFTEIALVNSLIEILKSLSFSGSIITSTISSRWPLRSAFNTSGKVSNLLWKNFAARYNSRSLTSLPEKVITIDGSGLGLNSSTIGSSAPSGKSAFALFTASLTSATACFMLSLTSNSVVTTT